MNCETARELLSVRLDGALTAAEDQTLRAHLDGCEACRVHESDLETVVGLVREIPSPPLEGSLVPDLRGRLPRRRRPAPIKWLVPLAAAACLLIVARLAVLTAPVEESLEVASATDDPMDADEGAPLDKMTAGRRHPEMVTGTREPADPPVTVSPPAPSEEPAPAKEAAPGEDAGAGPPAGGAAAPAAPEAPEARPEIARDRSEALRTWTVRGVEPDAAAGVILAELRSRRSRSEPAGRVHAGERVVQSGSGDVSGLVLSLTPSEIEFVTCLLEEREGVRVDRLNGHGKKRSAKGGEKPERVEEEDAGDAENGDDTIERRVKVRLDFARR